MNETFANSPNAQFAPWLKERIEESGLNIREFSEKAGVHFVSVYSYVRGAHVPTATILQKLCDAAGVPVESAPKISIRRGRHKTKTPISEQVEAGMAKSLSESTDKIPTVVFAAESDAQVGSGIAESLNMPVSVDAVAYPEPITLSPNVPTS